MRKTIVFIDSGDTLVDESTEVRDDRGVVQHAELIPGAQELLETLTRKGYRVTMVADGLAESFHNVYSSLKMEHCFEQCIYSSEVGEEKPSSKMFQAAMDAMRLSKEDKEKILMVGNNLKRDIIGANCFGIASVLLDWSPRYCMQPQNPLEKPSFVIHSPLELLKLLERLDKAD